MQSIKIIFITFLKQKIQLQEQMLQQQQQRMVCGFCRQVGIQKRKLLYVLWKMLSKELNFVNEKYATIEEDSQCHGFKQLIKMIFSQHFCQVQADCPHQQYYNHLFRKLGCSDTHFEFICKRLSERISERNYHLEILSVQIKNASQSIINKQITMKNVDQSLSQPQHNAPRQKSESLGAVKDQISEKQNLKEAEVRIQELAHKGGNCQEVNTGYVALMNRQMSIPELSSMNGMEEINGLMCMNQMNSLSCMSTHIDFQNVYCLPFTFLYNQPTMNTHNT